MTPKPQPTYLAGLNFTSADQQRFAAASGDRNPIHLDAATVRLTRPGASVVHGIHLLLRALGALAGATADRPPIRGIRCRFKNFVLVGDDVEVLLTHRTPDTARLNLIVAGVTVSQVVVTFGAPRQIATNLDGDLMQPPREPRNLDFENMAALSVWRSAGRKFVMRRPEGAANRRCDSNTEAAWR